MVARVTCSLWSFGPWSKAFPPLWLLHCSTCLPCSLATLRFGPSLYSECSFSNHLCLTGLRPPCCNSLFHMPPTRTLSRELEVIMTNDVLSETLIDRIPLFLYVCVFAVCLPRQKAGWASAIRSPSIYSSSTSQANLTFKSPTHTYWTALLSPVQIWKREMERGRVENSEMEKYPGLWLLGGAQKRIPHSWANLHSHGTSPVHSPLFSFLFSLLIHSLFL